MQVPSHRWVHRVRLDAISALQCTTVHYSARARARVCVCVRVRVCVCVCVCERVSE